LEPNDQVKLTDAIEVVKQEGNFDSLDNKAIEKALIMVAENIVEFKFIRLTKSIKRLDMQSNIISEEIDKLFEKFDTIKSDF
jgi:hypothetical protein